MIDSPKTSLKTIASLYAMLSFISVNVHYKVGIIPKVGRFKCLKMRVFEDCFPLIKTINSVDWCTCQLIKILINAFPHKAIIIIHLSHAFTDPATYI